MVHAPMITKEQPARAKRFASIYTVLTAFYKAGHDNGGLFKRGSLMKARTLLVPVLLVASVATASLARAQACAPPPMPSHGERAPDFGPGPGPGPGPAMPPVALQWSEAQQDKLFAVRHAAEPARRERAKAVQRARGALHQLVDSNRFDATRAVALAQALGQALAAEELDQAREQAQFLALLTPAQRDQMQRQRDIHGGEHDPQVRP